MATNHTKNYALNLWEPSDKFVRSEFNENTEKLDAALTELEQRKADATTVNAALAKKADAATVNTQLAAKADATTVNAALALKCRAIMGSYEGSGNDSQLIVLGCRPKAVLVWSTSGPQGGDSGGTPYYFGGFTVEGSPGLQFVALADSGFYARRVGKLYTNDSGRIFNYIAFC